MGCTVKYTHNISLNIFNKYWFYLHRFNINKSHVRFKYYIKITSYVNFVSKYDNN